MSLLSLVNVIGVKLSRFVTLNNNCYPLLVWEGTLFVYLPPFLHVIELVYWQEEKTYYIAGIALGLGLKPYV